MAVAASSSMVSRSVRSTSRRIECVFPSCQSSLFSSVSPDSALRLSESLWTASRRMLTMHADLFSPVCVRSVSHSVRSAAVAGRQEMDVAPHGKPLSPTEYRISGPAMCANTRGSTFSDGRGR